MEPLVIILAKPDSPVIPLETKSLVLLDMSVKLELLPPGPSDQFTMALCAYPDSTVPQDLLQLHFVLLVSSALNTKLSVW
jgi:hypothetical protein